MIPLLALSGVLLIGATALAVDLSLQTNNRRNLQVVTDAAGLAGARDLYTGANGTLAASDQANAVFNALSTIVTNMQWTSLPPNWANQQVASGCTNSPTKCDVKVTGLTIGGSTFSVEVDTPPLTGTNAGNTHYIQTIMHQTSKDFFAGVIGHVQDTQGAQSTAVHYPPGIPFGFALYTNTWGASGNAQEIIQGPVYANRYIAPQAAGQAGFCANPSAPGKDDGYIILGTPQSPETYDHVNNPGQIDINDPAGKIIGWQSPPCTTANTAGGVVQQTASSVNPINLPPTCPTITGANTTLTYNSTILACEANPTIQPPKMDPPPFSSTWKHITTPTTWTSAPASGSGVYEITHTSACSTPSCYDLDVNPPQNGAFTLNGYTFVLDADATIRFNGGVKNGPAVTLTPYNSGSGLPTDGRYVVYGASGSPVMSLKSADQDNSPSLLITSGTIYLPTGTVNSFQNGSLQDQGGQAIVGTWDVQSGNHPNPEITYNNANNSSNAEILSLVQ